MGGVPGFFVPLVLVDFFGVAFSGAKKHGLLFAFWVMWRSSYFWRRMMCAVCRSRDFLSRLVCGLSCGWVSSGTKKGGVDDLGKLRSGAKRSEAILTFLFFPSFGRARTAGGGFFLESGCLHYALYFDSPKLAVQRLWEPWTWKDTATGVKSFLRLSTRLWEGFSLGGCGVKKSCFEVAHNFYFWKLHRKRHHIFWIDVITYDYS